MLKMARFGALMAFVSSSAGGVAVATGYDHTLCSTSDSNISTQAVSCPTPTSNALWTAALSVTSSTAVGQASWQYTEPATGWSGLCGIATYNCVGELDTCYTQPPIFCLDIQPVAGTSFYTNGTISLTTVPSNPQGVVALQQCAPKNANGTCPFAGWGNLGQHSCCNGKNQTSIVPFSGSSGTYALPITHPIPPTTVTLLSNSPASFRISGEQNQPAKLTLQHWDFRHIFLLGTSIEDAGNTGPTGTVTYTRAPWTSADNGQWEGYATIDGQAGGAIAIQVGTPPTVPAAPVAWLGVLGFGLFAAAFWRKKHA